MYILSVQFVLFTSFPLAAYCYVTPAPFLDNAYRPQRGPFQHVPVHDTRRFRHNKLTETSRIPSYDHRQFIDHFRLTDHENYQNGGNLSEISKDRKNASANAFYKTYGMGRAVVPKMGAYVYIPRTVGSYKAYYDHTPMRYRNREASNYNDVHSDDCISCPKNLTVLAPKGHDYVFLPGYCANRYSHLSGPVPLSQLYEGLHLIISRMRSNRQICRYTFDVQVRRCPMIDEPNLQINCTAKNAWGSQCSFSCAKGLLDGAEKVTCIDSLKWSKPIPKCTESTRCEIPYIEKGTRISCKTSYATSDSSLKTLPMGSVCNIFSGNRRSKFKCKNGQWSKIHRKAGKNRNNGKRSSIFVKKTNPCPENPCLNNGTCVAEIDNGYVCQCPEAVEGPNCEFLQCAENHCLNNGKCLNYHNYLSCFCPSGFYGDKCQYKKD